jgi:hypothetical protein
MARAQNDLGVVRMNSQGFKDWVTTTDAALVGVEGADRIEAALTAAIDAFPFESVGPEFTKALGAFGESLASFTTLRDKLLADASGGALVTLEMVHNIPADTTKTNEESVFRFIAEGGHKGVDYTANASWTYLHGPLLGGLAHRLKTFDVSAQVDAPLSPKGTNELVFSLAGKCQRLAEDPSLPVPSTSSGTIWLGQAKVTIGAGTSGVKIPLSLTYSNRTELIKEAHGLTAHVGISYDLDALLSKSPLASKR